VRRRTREYHRDMIERQRASAVCVVLQHLLVVRLRDPLSGSVYHFVPGGAVEPGERPAVAAARETLEETGLEVRIDETSEVVGRYPFHWAGQTYDTTTHFFRAQPVHGSSGLPALATRDTPAYQLAALWTPIEQAATLMAFDANIWRFTAALLSGGR